MTKKIQSTGFVIVIVEAPLTVTHYTTQNFLLETGLLPHMYNLETPNIHDHVVVLTHMCTYVVVVDKELIEYNRVSTMRDKAVQCFTFCCYPLG